MEGSWMSPMATAVPDEADAEPDAGVRGEHSGDMGR